MVLRLSTPSREAENAPMKAFLLFLLIFSSHSFAQNFRMTGEFTLFGNTMNPLRPNFTLAWNENGPMIEGRYSDNVLAANAAVTGNVINGKRTFSIVFPSPNDRGVKSLLIETSDVRGISPSVPTSIVSRNLNGIPLESTQTFASLNEDTTNSGMQAQESTHCSTGFGALTGFCGLYAGNVAEAMDTGNNCNLIGSGGTRLELATNGELTLYFEYRGTLRVIPRHNFGSLLGTLMSQNLNTTVRHCGSLPDTTMNSVGCQTLHLVGSFQEFGGIKNFTGTYDIRDEVTGNRCSYSLNLGRESIY